MCWVSGLSKGKQAEGRVGRGLSDRVQLWLARGYGQADIRARSVALELRKTGSQQPAGGGAARIPGSSKQRDRSPSVLQNHPNNVCTVCRRRDEARVVIHAMNQRAPADARATAVKGRFVRGSPQMVGLAFPLKTNNHPSEMTTSGTPRLPIGVLSSPASAQDKE